MPIEERPGVDPGSQITVMMICAPNPGRFKWLVGRRYLSVESLALVLEHEGNEKEEVRELAAA